MPTKFSGSAPESETQLPEGGFSGNPAQHAHGFCKRELFAGEPGHKPAAADLAARLETAVDTEQIAPRRQPGGFALDQAPEDDARTEQQCPREMLHRLGSGLHL